MSLTGAVRSLAKSVESVYSNFLLNWQGYIVLESCGDIHKVKGFDNYNNLISINSIFSNYPKFDPVDRTGLALGPIKFASQRPWTIPLRSFDLHVAMQRRVEEICASKEKINIMWSGGIDSTAIVTAFLLYAPDRKQCRIVYSPWSTYEHPDYYKLLNSFTDLEMIDISGEIYINLDLDGVWVSGNTGDEMHASLDQSFFDKFGFETLQSSWKDFFQAQGANSQLIDFCEQHFSAAGRDIQTVLDARWWFYVSCKLTSILYTNDLTMLCSGPAQFDPKKLLGFFDCDAYESYMYHNTHKIIQCSNYASWKQELKNFCCEFDGFDNWRIHKTKFSSAQTRIYGLKKQILNDRRALIWLEDGSAVRTANLPMFSRSEWLVIKTKYDYLFRFKDSF